MQNDRRNFIKAIGFGALALVPTSLLSRVSAFAGEQVSGTGPTKQFKNLLTKTRQGNHVQLLNASKLPGEEKLAIAAVREIKPIELQAAFNSLKGGGAQSDKGGFCGGGCGGGGGDVGSICGAGCPSAIGKGKAVIDPANKLNLNIGQLNKQFFLNSLNQAMQFGR